MLVCFVHHFIHEGHDNTVSGEYSLAMGRKARVSDDFAGAVGLSADASSTCQSMGESTLNVCVDNGLYVNGELLDLQGIASLLAQQVGGLVGWRFVGVVVVAAAAAAAAAAVVCRRRLVDFVSVGLLHWALVR